MEYNVIRPDQYDIYINSIKKFEVNEIGTSNWFETHEILCKFNQQAIIEASTHREELVKELFVSNDKLKILVHEAYCILIWRTKVLPKLTFSENDTNISSFLLYSILYHEAVVISLLETLLYHENGCQALGDFSIDLVDYCAQAIVQLISLAHLKHVPGNFDPNKLQKETIREELKRQKNDLLYKIGVRCLTILSFIVDKIDAMSISVVRRIVVTHDIPCLLSEVQSCQPWIRNVNGVQKFIDDKWISIREIDIIKVTKVEAHVWFCLRQLLFNKEAMRFFEMTEFRQRKISKCQEFLTVNLLDQLPSLAELKHRLCTISQSNSNYKPGGIILEEVPEVKNRIVQNAKQISYNQIANNHMKRFFHLEKSELVNIAKRLNDSYNVELFEDLDKQMKEHRNVDNFCIECSSLALKKCSNCAQSYYCSRECQVKNWPIHKKNCLSK